MNDNSHYDINAMHAAAAEIIARVAPQYDPMAACFLYAEAAAAFVNDSAEFTAGAARPPSAAQRLGGAWGLLFNPRNPSSFGLTLSTELDEDGSFNGHCWVEFGGGHVLDLQESYFGPSFVDAAGDTLIYHAVQKLKRPVRKAHSAALKSVRREALRFSGKFTATRLAA